LERFELQSELDIFAEAVHQKEAHCLLDNLPPKEVSLRASMVSLVNDRFVLPRVTDV
jgi:hypothetical protein